MTEREAKERVVAAGKRLLEAGLIVRTWGNVSARIGSDRFAITPSGKAYEHLWTDDIALVNVADGKPAAPAIAAEPGAALASVGVPESPTKRGQREAKAPKPSSEKDLHAAVYRLRPDIRFVIHTHQVWASAVSALRMDMDVPPDLVPVLGTKVRCAAFALPTTKKLANNVATVLMRAGADERAVLLASHGAVCLGANDEEAFAVAEALEIACERFLRKGGRPESDVPERAESEWAGFGPIGSEMAGSEGTGPEIAGATDPRFYNSLRFDDHFKLYVGAADGEPLPGDEGRYICIPLDGGGSEAPRDAGADMKAPAHPIPPEAALHRRIYERWDHIHAIVHTADADVVEASRSGEPVRPFLDDFAQIVGPAARVVPGSLLPPAPVADVPKAMGNYGSASAGSAGSHAVNRPGAESVDGGATAAVGGNGSHGDWDRGSGTTSADWGRAAQDVAGKLRGRFAVMLQGHGAFCCAPSKDDALAVAHVMAKNCKALVRGRPFGGARPIPAWEAWLMRLVYMLSYSKRAGGGDGTREPKA